MVNVRVSGSKVNSSLRNSNLSFNDYFTFAQKSGPKSLKFYSWEWLLICLTRYIPINVQNDGLRESITFILLILL